MSIFSSRFAQSSERSASVEVRAASHDSAIASDSVSSRDVAAITLPEHVYEKVAQAPELGTLPGGLGQHDGHGIPGSLGDLGGLFGLGDNHGLPGGLGGLGGLFGHNGDHGGLGGLGGPGDFGGPGGLGGLFGDNGGNGLPGGLGGLGGLFGGDGSTGDWGGLGGLFGEHGGHGIPGGVGGPGGIFGGDGGTGLPGGLDGLGDIFGDGLGIPEGLGGRNMPDIKRPGDEVMFHESSDGKRVVADAGETLHVERGNKSADVKEFEKREGDTFVSSKEPNTYYQIHDGKVEKVGGSDSDKPNPNDPKGMPADDGSGGGPTWHSEAMPADDGSGGGPTWRGNAMPTDDGSGGGPTWRGLAMPADDGTGGGPTWHGLAMPADDGSGGGINWLTDSFSALESTRITAVAHAADLIDDVAETSHSAVSSSVAVHDFAAAIHSTEAFALDAVLGQFHEIQLH